MKSFMIGLDGSPLAESVLPYVELLATSSGAEVILVRAIPEGETIELVDDGTQQTDPYSSASSSPTVDTTGGELITDEASFDEARNYLEGIATRLTNRGIRVRSLVVAGDPASVIVDEAAHHHADAIILATHGRSGLGRLLYGSVAEAVLENSTVPVFLAKVSRGRLTLTTVGTKILVPLDGSALAEEALPHAVDLARALGAKLHLVRVVVPAHTYWAGEMAAFSYVSPTMIDDEEREATSYLDDLVARCQTEGVAATRSVRVENAALGIVATAEDEGVSFIVMATHGRTGLMRTLLGSVALQVLHESDVPILLVHPLKATKAVA